MIAVDSNVLLDVALALEHAEISRRTLHAQRNKTGLIISEVVYAEVSIAFKGEVQTMDEFLRAAGIEFHPSSREALALAGKIYKAYRMRGGKRDSMVPDFMIGAHAKVHAEALITRDGGFSQVEFGLKVINPLTG